MRLHDSIQNYIDTFLSISKVAAYVDKDTCHEVNRDIFHVYYILATLALVKYCSFKDVFMN